MISQMERTCRHCLCLVLLTLSFAPSRGELILEDAFQEACTPSAMLSDASDHAVLNLTPLLQLILTGQTTVRSARLTFATSGNGNSVSSVAVCDLAAHAARVAFQEVRKSSHQGAVFLRVCATLTRQLCCAGGAGQDEHRRR